MDFDTALDRLFAKERQPLQHRFEDKRVRMMLEAFALIDNKTHNLRYLLDLLQDCEQEHDERRLTFESFHRLFPTFPVVFTARYHSKVAVHCPPATLFRHFPEIFLFESYMEEYDRLLPKSLGRPIAMVVPFDGYFGGMVVHNGNFGTRTTKMLAPVPRDEPPHLLTVEPFLPLIRFLARGGWSPESPLPVANATQSPQVPQEMTFTRWLTKKLGPGPALVLLAWFRKVLFSPSGYDRHYVVRDKQGLCCVAATQEQMAAETGLSLRQVQRGLQKLKDEELIFKKPWQRQLCVWLYQDAIDGRNDEEDGSASSR